jgi:hypothetical protein
VHVAHCGPRGRASLALQQTDERIEVGGEEVLATEVTDDPLLVLAMLAVTFDEAHILMLDALATARLDDAEEHVDAVMAI